MMENNILLILSIALIADLIIPFLIAPFYAGYHHAKQVMSVLGSSKSPLHILYNSWLVIFGTILLIGSTILFERLEVHSRILAIIFIILLIAYAIGGCILSGFFSVGETKHLTTISEKIHGFGSVIGFILLTFVPLVCGLYWFRLHQISLAVFAIFCFLMAILFFILFIMADKPNYQHTIIASEGMWQRLTLVFMYLPIISVCVYSNS